MYYEYLYGKQQEQWWETANESVKGNPWIQVIIYLSVHLEIIWHVKPKWSLRTVKIRTNMIPGGIQYKNGYVYLSMPLVLFAEQTVLIANILSINPSSTFYLSFLVPINKCRKMIHYRQLLHLFLWESRIWRSGMLHLGSGERLFSVWASSRMLV